MENNPHKNNPMYGVKLVQMLEELEVCYVDVFFRGMKERGAIALYGVSAALHRSSSAYFLQLLDTSAYHCRLHRMRPEK